MQAIFSQLGPVIFLNMNSPTNRLSVHDSMVRIGRIIRKPDSMLEDQQRIFMPKKK